MKRILLTLAVTGVFWGQPAATQFEAASVKSSADTTPGPARGFGRWSGGPGTTSPGQFTAVGISLKNILLRDAYQLQDFQYQALPWMDNEIYDIVAKVPPGITTEQFHVMLQNLLIERFKIESHHEPRSRTSGELVVAKGGSKLTPSKFDPNAPMEAGTPHLMRDPDGIPSLPADSGPRPLMIVPVTTRPEIAMVTNRSTIANLVRLLSGNLHLPIVDKTGLQGEFAFTLHFKPEGMASRTADSAAAELGPPNVYDALQGQLGLKLETHKENIDVLVIDKAEKAPIEN